MVRFAGALEAEDLVDVAEQRLLGLLQGVGSGSRAARINIRASGTVDSEEAIGELDEAQPDFAAKAEEPNQWSHATAMVLSIVERVIG